MGDRLIEHRPMRDIPHRELKAEIGPRLLDYSVNLVGLTQPSRFRHCGSGTLVRIDDRRFVLTAGHCWGIGLADCDLVGLVLHDKRHRFTMRKEPAIVVGLNPDECEWGPDLAFVPITAENVGTIASIKTFYDLSGRRDAALASSPHPEWGLWAAVGAPAETSNLKNPTDLEFTQTVHWAAVKHQPDRGCFDYIDALVPLGAQGLPSTFGGISGGGLWQINIARDGEKWGWFTPQLQGCVFYETPTNGGDWAIRCHGPKTVFREGIDAVRRK